MHLMYIWHNMTDAVFRVPCKDTHRLHVDLGDDTRPDGLAALTEGEARSRLHGNIMDELADHFDVVTGHDEALVRVFGTLGEGERDGNVGGTDE